MGSRKYSYFNTDPDKIAKYNSNMDFKDQLYQSQMANRALLADVDRFGETYAKAINRPIVDAIGKIPKPEGNQPVINAINKMSEFLEKNQLKDILDNQDTQKMFLETIGKATEEVEKIISIPRDQRIGNETTKIRQLQIKYTPFIKEVKEYIERGDVRVNDDLVKQIADLQDKLIIANEEKNELKNKNEELTESGEYGKFLDGLVRNDLIKGGWKTGKVDNKIDNGIVINNIPFNIVRNGKTGDDAGYNITVGEEVIELTGGLEKLIRGRPLSDKITIHNPDDGSIIEKSLERDDVVNYLKILEQARLTNQKRIREVHDYLKLPENTPLPPSPAPQAAPTGFEGKGWSKSNEHSSRLKELYKLAKLTAKLEGHGNIKKI